MVQQWRTCSLVLHPATVCPCCYEASGSWGVEVFATLRPPLPIQNALAAARGGADAGARMLPEGCPTGQRCGAPCRVMCMRLVLWLMALVTLWLFVMACLRWSTLTVRPPPCLLCRRLIPLLRLLSLSPLALPPASSSLASWSRRGDEQPWCLLRGRLRRGPRSQRFQRMVQPARHAMFGVLCSSLPVCLTGQVASSIPRAHLMSPSSALRSAFTHSADFPRALLHIW